MKITLIRIPMIKGCNRIILLLLSLLITSCSPKIKQSVNHQNQKPSPIKETQILIFQNGVYTSITTDQTPEPSRGKDQFYRDMYIDLRYPADARERGIQGSVLFEVEISTTGDVVQIKKTQSLSPDCDKEAEKAIKRGCKHGFIPYEYSGEIVRVKYIIPVKFRLI